MCVAVWLCGCVWVDWCLTHHTSSYRCIGSAMPTARVPTRKRKAGTTFMPGPLPNANDDAASTAACLEESVLPLPASSIIIETADIANASPASLSQCCVVCVNPPHGLWKCFVESWLATSPVVTALPSWARSAAREVLVGQRHTEEIIHALRTITHTHGGALYKHDVASVAARFTQVGSQVALVW